MNPLNLISDSYDRPARLYPALLLISPIIATIVATLSPQLSIIQSVAASAAGLGGSLLLTQVARDAGKRREKRLHKEWGGLPSVAIFRHRDSRLDSVTKARYHKTLSGLVKTVKAPTKEKEQSDPEEADNIYAAWSHFIRSNTRDTKKHPLLFQENVNYGYRRNVWGLRPTGILICILAMSVCGWRLWENWTSTSKMDGPLLGAGIFSALLLSLWLFLFTSSWVRIPADAYAERLAECLETFSKVPKGK